MRRQQGPLLGAPTTSLRKLLIHVNSPLLTFTLRRLLHRYRHNPRTRSKSRHLLPEATRGSDVRFEHTAKQTKHETLKSLQQPIND